MCEYCEKKRQLPIKFENAICEGKEEFILSQRIEEEKIFISANLGFMNAKGKPDYRSTLSSIRINYCPMCGKDLRK